MIHDSASSVNPHSPLVVMRLSSATTEVIGSPKDMMNKMNEQSAGTGEPNRTGLLRVVDVLEALSSRFDAEPWGVRELAEALGESRSTINRILAAFADIGLAAEHQAGKYSAGPKLRVLADIVLRRHALPRNAKDLMRGLSRKYDATFVMSLHDPTSRSFFRLAAVEAPSAFRYRTRLGLSLPLQVDEGPILDGLVRGKPEACGFATSAFTVSGQAFALGAFFADGAQATLQSAELIEDLNRTASIIASEADIRDDLPVEPMQMAGERAAIGRTYNLIRLLVGRPGGLLVGRSLFELIQVSESAGRRLITAAISSGIALQTSQGLLVPGPQLYRIAAQIGTVKDTLEIVQPDIANLAMQTGETIGFLAYNRDTESAQITETFSGWRPIQYRLETGVDVVLYAGAAGKAVLAHCPDDVLSRQELTKLTDNTVTDLSVLRSDLEHIRERGWATGEGERIPGAFGVAVPYFADGQIAGSITATISQDRKAEVDVSALAGMMQVTANKVTSLLSLL